MRFAPLGGVDESYGKGFQKKRKLRVAIVAPTLKILGGHSIQAQQLLAGWSTDDDVDAWLVPINPAPPEPFARLLKIKYLRTVITQLLYWPQLLVELSRADVVHVFSASYSSFLLSPLPAILVARLLHRPVVLNYHSGEADDHLTKSAFARSIISGCERIVVPSKYLVDVFARHGLEAVAIPNAIDRGRFAFRDRRPLRPRLLSVRNFESLYNVACTLKAFRLVQKSWPNATLTLVGAGSEDVMLRRLADELELDGVTFIGRLSPERMPECYAAHDIYIQTPNIDNMPISVLEAYACGLPVVSTEAGGVPAIVAHGHTGLLAPLDDHLAVAARVLLLLEQPGVAGELVQHAREACEAYTWPAVREQWLGEYRRAHQSGAMDVAVAGAK